MKWKSYGREKIHQLIESDFDWILGLLIKSNLSGTALDISTDVTGSFIKIKFLDLETEVAINEISSVRFRDSDIAYLIFRSLTRAQVGKQENIGGLFSMETRASVFSSAILAIC